MPVIQNVLAWPGAGTPDVLRDGTEVRVRPVRPGDEDGVRTLLEGMSTCTLHLRFLGLPHLARTARALVHVAPGDVALVVEADGRIVAHAACLRAGAETAEVAFLVADAWQGRGLGGLLLDRLSAHARSRGITTLIADVLPANRPMLAVFERSGLDCRVRSHDDAVRVQMTALRRLPLAA